MASDALQRRLNAMAEERFNNREVKYDVSELVICEIVSISNGSKLTSRTNLTGEHTAYRQKWYPNLKLPFGTTEVL
jgi:hypothetical protein